MLAVLLIAIFLSLPERVHAIAFDIGMSSFITVVANERANLQATVINRGDEPLPINFHTSVGATGEGLSSLNFEGLFITPDIILQPNEAFQFTFGSISFDPYHALTTVLHPLFTPLVLVRPERDYAGLVPTTISIGDHLSYSTSMNFVPVGYIPVPEPSSLAMLSIGLLVIMLVGFHKCYQN